MVTAINGPPVLNGAAYVYPSKTMAQLRDDLLCMLGFPDPLTNVDAETKTLVYLREKVYRRLGHYYVAGANPPNVDEQVDAWINEAQQTIFRMAELDQAGIAFPAYMTADVDPTSFDYVPVLALATAQAKAHNQQSDAKIYFEEIAKYMSDRALRRPPNILNMCTKWLERAQDHLYFKYAILRTERWWKIPIVQGSRIYDVPSIATDPAIDVAFVDGGVGADTITRLTGSWLDEGLKAGMRIKAFGATDPGNNNTQWVITSVDALTITLPTASIVAESAGASIVISTVNHISLDFRTVTEAWLFDDPRWLPLQSGIGADLYNMTQPTTPTRYELREYFEIFPIPNKAFIAWIKGHMGLMEFTADTDTTTIDPEAVFLQALVWGKMHFRQPDAMQHAKELDDYVRQLNAGRHAGKRYIPNPDKQPVALPYPQVTFART